MTLSKPKPLDLTVTCRTCGKSETKAVVISEENVFAEQIRFVSEFAKGHVHG